MSQTTLLIVEKGERPDWLQSVASIFDHPKATNAFGKIMIRQHNSNAYTGYNVSTDNTWLRLCEFDDYCLYYAIVAESGEERVEYIKESFASPFIILVESNNTLFIEFIIENIDSSHAIIDNDYGLLASVTQVREFIQAKIDWLHLTQIPAS